MGFSLSLMYSPFSEGQKKVYELHSIWLIILSLKENIFFKPTISQYIILSMAKEF